MSERRPFDPGRLTTDKPALDPELERVSADVIGAAIDVHRELGPGFLESVYEEAMRIELGLRNIRFTRQAPVRVTYKGHSVGEGRVDLLVEDRIVVELKTVECLAPIHKAQVISYLRALNCRLGLLMNFRTPTLKDGLMRVIL